jgi:amino-acid N-acetyltransferase
MTTQSAHWFLENGYKLSEIEALPDEKKALYSTQRNSKVLIKELEKE